MKSVKFTAIIFSCALILASLILLSSSDGIVEKMMPEKLSSTADSLSTAAEERLLADAEKPSEKYGKLPISFEPNIGQTDKSVRFLARGAGYSLFLKNSEALLSLHKPIEGTKATSQSTIRMRMSGANQSPLLEGLDQTDGKTNYLTGNDPSQWHTDIPNYAQVRSHDVLPGIDTIYYGNGQQFEYDFVVPGAFGQYDYTINPIVSLSASGRLDVHSEYGTFFSPRISMLARVGHWTSRVSVGTGFFASTPLTEETEAAGLTRLTLQEPLEAERRDGHFNVFEGRQPAVAWLTAARVRMELAGHD